MTYLVTDGYVTVPTTVDGGVAHVDVPRGAALPADVPAEHVDALLAQGRIQLVDPDGSGEDENGDGVPEGSARQVLEWVHDAEEGEDRDERARLALDAEQVKGGNARKGLVAELTKLLEG
jgi:hypothetical protein